MVKLLHQESDISDVSGTAIQKQHRQQSVRQQFKFSKIAACNL